MTATLFASFMRAMGFNGRQKAEAGETIGLTKYGSYDRAQGRIPVSQAEALAMTAAFLKLPEWRADFADLSPKQRKRVMRAAKVIRDTWSGEREKDVAA